MLKGLKRKKSLPRHLFLRSLIESDILISAGIMTITKKAICLHTMTLKSDNNTSVVKEVDWRVTSMSDIINKVISPVMRFIPSFGAAFGFAQKATDTSNNVKFVMPTFPVQEKAEEITKNPEYARSIVQLAIIETSYNTARGILHVSIYAILVWGLCKLAQNMLLIGNQKEKGK